MRRTLLPALLIATAHPMNAQMSTPHDHHDAATNSSLAPIIARAREAAEIFSDRKAAIARGYRRVGRDLPMMGEHWLNTRLLVDGIMDVARPQVLTYLDVGGKPRLTGVVYAIALKPGEVPPDIFGEQAMWHEHNGSIDEEALVPEHHSTASTTTGTRVAFLHVWTHMPSSESVFAAENWALPFVRAGLSVPDRFSNYAARSVSLIDGGGEYYMDMIGSRGDSAVFDRYAVEAGEVVLQAKVDHRALTGPELVRLDEIWRRLLRDVEASTGVDTMRRIK